MGHPKTALGLMEAWEKKKQRMEIDHFKKMQCFVTLKRLMVHPDGWPFKKNVDGNALAICDYSDIVSRPLVDLETVKWKLEKGLYVKSDQFANDIRIMFCNAMLYYPESHEIHKIAMKLSELFETKWKSLQERWTAERAKGEEEKAMPLGKARKVSVGVKVCGFVTSKEGKKRTVTSELSSEEKTCANSALNAKLSTEKVTGIAKPRQHFLDTILAAQSSLFGCNVGLKGKKETEAAELFNCNVDLKRKRDREAARVMLQKIERTVFIDDGLKSFEELERLCGLSLTDCNRVNPLKDILGLVLKDEFMTVTDLDDEKFLSGDWEEGEIVFFG